MDTYGAAKLYQSMGWHVIPIQNNSKKPAVKWREYETRPPTDAELETWFKGTDHNIAVLTGPSDLLVIDVDEGATAIIWPSTLCAESPSGGNHYFYSGGGHLKTGQGDLGKHVDTRAKGGYVLVAPSEIEGIPYKFTSDLEQITPLPETVKQQLMPSQELELPEVPEGDLLTKIVRDGFTPGQHNTEVLKLTKQLYRALYGDSNEFKSQTLWNLITALDGLDPTPQAYDGTLIPTVKQAVKYERDRLKKETTSSTTPKLEVITYSDSISKWSDYQTTYLIDGWFPEQSIMYMAALPESWKTWMLLDIALSLSLGKGEPFLNRFEITPHLPMRERVPVLLFQQEDHPGELFKRMQIIQSQKVEGVPYQYIYDSSTRTMYFDSPYSAPLYIHENAELDFSNPEIFQVLEERIVQTGAKAVLIDPLYSLMPAGNYFMEMGLALKQLKGIRVRTGAAFMFAHHNKKSATASDGRQGAYGSVFSDGAMEGALAIYKTPNPRTIKVQRSGKFLAERNEYRLTFDVCDGYKVVDGKRQYVPDDIHYLVEVEEGADHFTGQFDESVYQFILENGSVPATAIQKELDISRATVYNILKKLEESGHIIKAGRKYEIPLEMEG